MRFFVDVLGFTAWVTQPDYAYVQRETAGIRIMRASRSPGEKVPPGNRRFMYYIDVKNVAAVIAEVRPKLAEAGLLEGHGPVDQSYGQREFMVTAPDGNLLVFGQSLSAVTGE